MVSQKAIDEMREADGIGWIHGAQERIDPCAARQGIFRWTCR